MNRRLLLQLLLTSAYAWPFNLSAKQPQHRVICIGGGLTEIVYALGAEDRLVAVDTTSVYPPETQRLPSVGYARTLSVEGLLSLSPTLIIATEDSGPPAVLSQIKRLGIPLQIIPSYHTYEGVIHRIEMVGKLLQMKDQAAKLVENVASEWAAVQQTIEASDRSPSPKVLFLLSAKPGQMIAGGDDTSAAAMIRYAGGINLGNAITGWKNLNDEALIGLAPDIILVSSQTNPQLGDLKVLAKHPGIAQTPAGKHQRIIQMDTMLLLGFGPRFPMAVKELHQKFKATLA